MESIMTKKTLSDAADGILVIDDLFSKESLDKIELGFLDGYFPWHMGTSSYSKDDGGTKFFSATPVNDDFVPEVVEGPQLMHMFLKDGTVCSHNFNLIEFLLDTISKNVDTHPYTMLGRVKANLQFKKDIPLNCYNTPHIDIVGDIGDESAPTADHLVMIFYVNDADSDTVIFENTSPPWKIKKSINSKRGRIVIFNGNLYHAGCHPRETEHRIVINFNFLNTLKYNFAAQPKLLIKK
jgi:hypothetical protein